MYQLKTECKNELCPRLKTCIQLPTDVYPSDTGEVNILFVGQGGGKEEKEQCRPFVGIAGIRGKNQVLKARELFGKPIGIAFGNVIRDYIADHDPQPEHVNHCIGFLYDQIRELSKLSLQGIISFGDKATSFLIGDLRGKGSFQELIERSPLVFSWINDSNGDIKAPIYPTHHPSRLNREGIIWNKDNPSDKDMEVINTIIRVLSLSNSLTTKSTSKDVFKGLLSEPIYSSNIDKVGYSSYEKRLVVRFKSGGLYEYRNVPHTIYESLIESRSAGSYFHKNIRSKFDFKIINNTSNEVNDEDEVPF